MPLPQQSASSGDEHAAKAGVGGAVGAGVPVATGVREGGGGGAPVGAMVGDGAGSVPIGPPSLEQAASASPQAIANFATR
jgi:hypothetical protein